MRASLGEPSTTAGGAVGVGVGVGVSVGVAVGAGDGVSVGECVAVGAGVGEGEFVGFKVFVTEGIAVSVGDDSGSNVQPVTINRVTKNTETRNHFPGCEVVHNISFLFHLVFSAQTPDRSSLTLCFVRI